MKKIFSAFLAVVMMLALVSCGDTDVPEGMKLASESNVPYKFYVPTAWVTQDGDNLSMAYYSVADQSSVQVLAYADSMTIDEYWAKCCEDYSKAFAEFIPEEKVVDTVLGEKAAKQYTYTVKHSEKEYKMLQVVTSRDNLIYTMIYTSTPELFDSHIEQVEEMIEVFRFR